jgi:SH3 domain-containing YSC84-like protein 1
VRKFLTALLIVTAASIGWAQKTSDDATQASGHHAKAEEKNSSDLQARFENAARILQQMTTEAPDKGVPRTVLDNAKCVAVVPHEIKGAFVIGAQHGSGFATCRAAHGWSAPAPFSMTGISWGPQIGGESRALIMMFMNDEAAKNLIAGHFKVGGEVSAAAGPVGREASGNAGWKAGILTYSRTKGAFVGASINGAGIQQDDATTKQVYGRDVTFKDILEGNVRTPAIARSFVNAVANAKESAASR